MNIQRSEILESFGCISLSSNQPFGSYKKKGMESRQMRREEQKDVFSWEGGK